MERTHRTRPPVDVEEALSSILWTPYDQNDVEDSPPYQRRNHFAFQPPPALPPEYKGQPTKLRPMPTNLVPASSRFSFPFISSISGSSGNTLHVLPSYEEVNSGKRLSMPPNPNYVAPRTSRRTRMNQSFTDEFISRALDQVR